MQQSSALLLLGLLTAAAAKSSGTEEGAQAPAAAERQTAAAAPTPSESLRHQYLPEDSLGDLASGDAFPGQSGRWFPHVENTSDPRSWRDAFMKVYAASYLHFAHASDDLPPGPEHARDARNITDLKKWKARQEAAIKAFVPKEFKQAAREAVEGSFDRRASELEAEQEAATKQTSNAAVALPAFLVAAAGRPMKAETEVGGSGRYAAGRLPYVSRPNDPMAWKQAFMQEYAASYMEMLAAEESVARQHPDAPAHARDCHTISELRGWRHAQEARIKAFVPGEFQKMAAADVERKFEKREVALADEGAGQPQQQARQTRKEAPSGGDAHSGKAADSKRGTAGAKKEEEVAAGDAHSGKATDSKRGTAGAKQEEKLAAGDAHSSKATDSKRGTAGAKQEDPQSATVLAALPRGRGAPLLAASVGLLASLATGALVARRRMQRTLDLGSYLLAAEA